MFEKFVTSESVIGLETSVSVKHFILPMINVQWNVLKLSDHFNSLLLIDVHD